MSSVTPPSPIRDIDYDALEAALLQTARGSWFLAEYVRRSQPAEFASLREALQKLEHAITTPVSPPAAAATPISGPTGEALRHDLIEMSEAISRTRREIASIKPSDAEDSQLMNATGELDAIVAATEHATSGILEAAEDIQEVAWLLREKGIEEDACDRLDGRATEIYTACSFQDITGQRIQKVVGVLRFLESRVVAMMGIWGLEELAVDLEMPGDDRPDAHLLNGPQLEGQGLEQGDIDDMIDATSFDAVSENNEEPAAAVEQPNHDVVSIVPAAETNTEVTPSEVVKTAEVVEPVEVETAPALEEVSAGDQADGGKILGTVDELVAASAAIEEPVATSAPVIEEPAKPVGEIDTGELLSVIDQLGASVDLNGGSAVAAEDVISNDVAAAIEDLNASGDLNSGNDMSASGDLNAAGDLSAGEPSADEPSIGGDLGVSESLEISALGDNKGQALFS